MAGALLLILFGWLAARGRARYLIPVALCATAAVPWSAFLDGHPFRIRYMVPLIAFEAVAAGALAGLASGLLRRGHPLGRVGDVALAALLAGVAAFTLRPLDTTAPMVVEAQWDRPNAPVRAAGHRLPARALRRQQTIMASMGSLGHYMQETSHDGFDLRDFLHEGNGDIWLAALEGSEGLCGLAADRGESRRRRLLARRAREHPHFLRRVLARSARAPAWRSTSVRTGC